MDKISFRFDFFSMILFLGICQGTFLSVFFIFKKGNANKYLGWLLIAFSLMILDYFLCYTYLMLKIVWILNYSESLTLLIGPLIFLHIKNQLRGKSAKDFLHLVPFISYLIYYLIFLVQPYESKFNSYINCWNINIPPLNSPVSYELDPLSIRKHFILIILVQMSFYAVFSFVLIFKHFLNNNIHFFKTDNSKLKWLRDISLVFILLVLTVIIINAINPYCNKVIGISIVISGFIYFTSFRVLVSSSFYGLALPQKKYVKSGVSIEEKKQILQRIIKLFEEEKIYKDNLISLPGLSKKIGYTVNVTSQIINEKLNKSFFELLSQYRINEAKSLLLDKRNENLTIIEISEMVGYNSKSAFNQAFKKQTGMTPSEFKHSI